MTDTNLLILRRSDSEIEEVLFTAAHVCLYHMALDSQQWSRKNVEGSLFLYKRRTSPRFQMKVLNKLTTLDYVESIHAGMDFEVNSPYLMYTHGNSEIHGIWFYEAEDLNRIGALLNRIKSGLPKPDILPGVEGAAAAAPADDSAGAEDQGDGAEEAAFWDTPKKAAPAGGAPPPLQAAPQALPAPSPNNLTKLLKNATIKQQQQQQVAAAAPQAPPLLTPSFFAQADSGDKGAPPPAQAPPPKENPLQRFFPNGQAPAPAPAPTPIDHKAASLDGSNAIAKLFNKAAPPGMHRAAPPPHQQQPPPQQQQQQPPPQPPPQQQQPPQQQHVQDCPQVVRDKLRGAFGRLMQNDHFVDMLAAEFRAAGLLH